MKPRQINLFADKKHYREMNARLQKEVREIMRKQLPLPLVENHIVIQKEYNQRREIGCGVWK